MNFWKWFSVMSGSNWVIHSHEIFLNTTLYCWSRFDKLNVSVGEKWSRNVIILIRMRKCTWTFYWDGCRRHTTRDYGFMQLSLKLCLIWMYVNAFELISTNCNARMLANTDSTRLMYNQTRVQMSKHYFWGPLSSKIRVYFIETFFDWRHYVWKR